MVAEVVTVSSSISEWDFNPKSSLLSTASGMSTSCCAGMEGGVLATRGRGPVLAAGTEGTRASSGAFTTFFTIFSFAIEEVVEGLSLFFFEVTVAASSFGAERAVGFIFCEWNVIALTLRFTCAGCVIGICLSFRGPKVGPFVELCTCVGRSETRRTGDGSLTVNSNSGLFNERRFLAF
jgi:hypothetical protein